MPVKRRAARNAASFAALDGSRLPTLDGGRVVLRWPMRRDVDGLHAIFSDPAVMRYWSSTPLESKAAARRLLAEMREEFRNGVLFEWVLARRDDDMAIGTCTLFHLDRENRRAEIGFALARSCWGKGLMSEGLGLLTAFCFRKLGLRRLEADVDPRNAASIRCLERLGFVEEGMLRERWSVGGAVQDTLLFGLLVREWQAPE